MQEIKGNFCSYVSTHHLWLHSITDFDSLTFKGTPHGELPRGAGVIPRAVKQIFDTLESQNAEYSVKVTFLELYNEEITDLLAPEDLSKVVMEDKQKKQLPLMEDGKGGVLVRGLEEEIVANASEIFSLLERGSAKRRTAETLLNKQSRLLSCFHLKSLA